jgi:hypothetical protein
MTAHTTLNPATQADTVAIVFPAISKLPSSLPQRQLRIETYKTLIEGERLRIIGAGRRPSR